MTKNTVIVMPMPVKLRSKSCMSHGKSGGSSRWKKCETPCTKPIRVITSISLRWGAGRVAVVMGKVRVKR
jgi:hypothetical protein